MNTTKNAQRITGAIRQFELSTVTIEKALSEWESNRSELDLLIFFIMRIAAYKATLLTLAETISALFDAKRFHKSALLSHNLLDCNPKPQTNSLRYTCQMTR